MICLTQPQEKKKKKFAWPSVIVTYEIEVRRYEIADRLCHLKVCSAAGPSLALSTSLPTGGGGREGPRLGCARPAARQPPALGTCAPAVLPENLSSRARTVLQSSFLWSALVFLKHCVVFSHRGKACQSEKRLGFAVMLVLFVLFSFFPVKSTVLFRSLRQVGLLSRSCWKPALLLPAFISVFSSTVPLKLTQHTDHVTDL